MYKRILLAYDGSVEGRSALREGALLAKRVGAQVLFLSVIADSSGINLAESGHPGAMASQYEGYKAVFDDGLARLKQLGLAPVSRMVAGDPAREIVRFAREKKADLVVVSHRKQSLLARWWSGSNGAYLSETLDCSLLISRNTISDAEFLAEIEQPQA